MASNEPISGGLSVDAIVIRGGMDMRLETLLQAFQDHAAIREDRGEPKVFAISMNCAPDKTLHEVAVKAQRPNRMVTPTTVGAIEEAGFEVIPTPNSPAGHCDVFIRDAHYREPTLVELIHLQAAFGQPVRNPAAQSREAP